MTVTVLTPPTTRVAATATPGVIGTTLNGASLSRLVCIVVVNPDSTGVLDDAVSSAVTVATLPSATELLTVNTTPKGPTPPLATEAAVAVAVAALAIEVAATGLIVLPLAKLGATATTTVVWDARVIVVDGSPSC